MITCTFEDGGKASLRHVVVHIICEQAGKLLLVKRSPSLSLEGGKWALPGGFLDRDETGEQAALRELREETGWEGRIISMFRLNTNPNRPHEDRQNVAIDYLAEPIRLVDTMDHETTAVEWVPLSKLPPLSSLAFDHGESIEKYIAYRAKPFALPIV